MDHGKRRGAYRTSGEADHIDLGHEPPLSVDGETNNLIDRRRVSVQWFSGTILTGLCGAALMGGAVFASLDGQSNFATVPERVQLALRGSGDRAAATARKADRLPPPSESNAQRRVIRDTQTSRVGNREVVRVRAFVRVASNLALSTSELSANIPAFNPLRMQAAEATPGAATADESPDAEVDAEVSFVTADLATVLPRAKIAAVLSIDDVLVRVREAANWTGSTPPRQLTPELPRGTRLAYAAEGITDPYAGFETRMAPENVTLLPKTQKETTGGTPWSERTVAVRKGETVASVLRELGARPDDIKAITAALGARGRDGGVRENHKLRVLLAPTDDPKFVQPIRVVIANDSAIEAVVAWSDLGRYVQVDIRNLETEVARSRQQQQDEEEDDGRGVRLYQSIYETALRNQVPRPLIEDLIRIYSYDVDFQRRVQPGDSFEVLFTEDEGSNDSKGEVLIASLTTGGETRRYYRFQSADDGLVDFYDDTGKSAKKFLVRKPLADGIMRSGFGMRNHPLLRQYRAAHRCGLGGADGHADLRIRQWHGRKDGMGRRLWPLHPRPARQRLPDRLRPHVGLRPQHDRGQARSAGPDHRLRRLHRPVDRRPPALRDHRQRPPRRPDEVPPAARSRARGRNARELRARARAARQHDQPRRPDTREPAARRADVDDDALIFNPEKSVGWEKARPGCASLATWTVQAPCPPERDMMRSCHGGHGAARLCPPYRSRLRLCYFFWPSSTLRSGLDFVASASRAISGLGVAYTSASTFCMSSPVKGLTS